MSTPRSPDRARRCLVLLGVALGCATAGAESVDRAAERQRIARERAELQAHAREAEAACATQFAVSACVERERGRHREQLRQLDRQRAVIEEAERKQRAAERQERIRARQQAEAADASARVAAPPRAARSLPAASSKPGRPAPDPPARAEARARAASAAEATAAQRAHDAARRAQETAAHRELIEQRNREREASKKKKKPGAPLPLPPAASLPR